jgi:hypothetical protein
LRVTCRIWAVWVRWAQRNVQRWSSGEVALRWTAAGMLEAERQFRKAVGYRDLATLPIAVERDTTGGTRPTSHPRRPLWSWVPDRHTGPPPRDRKDRAWGRSS